MAPKIYIIEDADEIAEFYAKSLNDQGFKSEAFTTAEACLDRLSKGDWPDVLLVDQKLPGMTGLAFIKKLRSMEIDCPVVIVTGQGDTQKLSIEAMDLSVYAVLQKPIELKSIAGHLKKIVSHHRSLKLSDDLINEFHYFTTCAEQLIDSYKRQMSVNEEEYPALKNSLRTMIIKKEAEKWSRELNKAKSTIQKMRQEQKKLKSFLPTKNEKTETTE